MGLLDRLRGRSEPEPEPAASATPAADGDVEALVDDLVRRLPAKPRTGDRDAFREALLARPPEEYPRIVLALADRETRADVFQLHQTLFDTRGKVLRRKAPWTDAQLVDLIGRLDRAAWDPRDRRHYLPDYKVTSLVPTIARAARDGLSDELRPAVERLRELLTIAHPHPDAQQRKALGTLAEVLGDVGAAEPLAGTGDAWAQALRRVAAEHASAGDAVLVLAAGARGTQPPKRFTEGLHALRDAHGDEPVAAACGAMLAAVAAQPGNEERGVIPAETSELTRGLVWIATATPVAPAVLADLAVASFKKVRNHGMLSRKLGEAAVDALARRPDGAGELGRVRSAVKQAAAVEAVEAAIDAAAERLGTDRSVLEERSVPDHGLAGGVREVVLGEHTAILALDDRLVPQLRFRSGTQERKTAPAAVRDGHADALKALRAEVKAIRAQVGAQRARLERLLVSERTWPLDEWRAAYDDHGLVGPVARRLIWTFDDVAALWLDGGWVRADGTPVEPGPDARVGLWHPVDADPGQVLAWRTLLEARGVRQPFKQAHREIYLLTDAERETGVYSNRFAAHVLRQHQFSALCGERGWRYALQGSWDGGGTGGASLRLPALDLAADFVVEPPWDGGPIGAGVITEAGVFRLVVTDRVRVTRLGTPDPVELADVPVRALSEILRDVDLFVGVTSVGNDPEWTDRGEDRRFDGYWHEYAFGPLGETGTGRAEVLGRLLPRLAIADRCSVDGRFLRVRGDRRTYRIHLGSTNVLMEPDDQYLCVVSGGSGPGDGVFLPFEGDRGLALVLSKAFLLADDTAITDRTILSQLDR